MTGGRLTPADLAGMAARAQAGEDGPGRRAADRLLLLAEVDALGCALDALRAQLELAYEAGRADEATRGARALAAEHARYLAQSLRLSDVIAHMVAVEDAWLALRHAQPVEVGVP